MKMKGRTETPFHIATDGLALGDHILSRLPARERHGIYAGGCQVVCYAGGVIAEIPLDTFAGGGGIDIIWDKAEFPAAEIVRRAKAMTVASAEFEFISGDHFCRWCRRGPLPVN